jgi:hypothetical protein
MTSCQHHQAFLVLPRTHRSEPQQARRQTEASSRKPINHRNHPPPGQEPLERTPTPHPIRSVPSGRPGRRGTGPHPPLDGHLQACFCSLQPLDDRIQAFFCPIRAFFCPIQAFFCSIQTFFCLVQPFDGPVQACFCSIRPVDRPPSAWSGRVPFPSSPRPSALRGLRVRSPLPPADGSPSSVLLTPTLQYHTPLGTLFCGRPVRLRHPAPRSRSSCRFVPSSSPPASRLALPSPPPHRLRPDPPLDPHPGPRHRREHAKPRSPPKPRPRL